MGRAVVQFPSSYYEDQRNAELTDFRCQQCECRYPFSQLVVQDGAKLCRINCACDYSPSETEEIVAAAREEAAELTASTVEAAMGQLAEAPNYSLMDGVAACTKIVSGLTVYPNPISVTSGGAAVPVSLTGVSFTSSDVITYSPAAGISNDSPVIATDGLSQTFNVTITVRGDYDFLYNGTRFRKVFAAR